MQLSSIGVPAGALLGYGLGTIVSKTYDKCFPTNISLINGKDNITNYGTTNEEMIPPLVDVAVINKNSSNPLVNKNSTIVQLTN